MMITPRSYVQQAPRKTRSTDYSEKSPTRSTRSPSGSPRAQSPLASQLFRPRPSSPNDKRSPSGTAKPLLQATVKQPELTPRPAPTPIVPVESNGPQYRRASTKDLLSATAIPIRRKPRGRVSQRLPRGDHVANFSSLLMEDFKPSMGGSIPRSVSSSNFEGLFGNMDELLEEGQMYVGSEGVDSGVLSTRSLSDDSLVSMPSPDDYTADDRNSQHSSVGQSVSDRRLRHMATSEDCSDDHPLSLPNEDATFLELPAPAIPPPKFNVLEGRQDRKPRSTLKSGLTASFKALKAAAQSVSNRTGEAATSEQARSFFDFKPYLTDDRRPPPALKEPTPELRRYLNPPPLDSAAQLHFWQDHRHSKFDRPPKEDPGKRSRSPKRKKTKVSIGGRSPSPPGINPRTRDLPAIVQLSDCLPPSVRTENASSPPIWLTPDGTPVNKNTAIPLLYDPNANDGKGEPAISFRHREPRENRDFLRVFVCEMEMRRCGKLSDDLSAGRARLWLPPVGQGDTNPKPRREGDSIDLIVGQCRVEGRKTASERMVCTSIDDV